MGKKGTFVRISTTVWNGQLHTVWMSAGIESIGQWREKSLPVRIMNSVQSFWVFLLLNKVYIAAASR